MSDDQKNVTRRGFLRGAAGVTVAGAAGVIGGTVGTAQAAPAPEGAAPQQAPGGKRSTVVLVRDEKVVDAGGATSAEIISKMLDDGVVALSGKADAAGAWKSLFGPSDTVGIKTNIWSYLRTPPSLEDALRRRLTEAGVPADRISVDDRGVLRNPIFQKASALINVRPMRTHHWSGVGSLMKNYIMFHESPPTWHDDSCANLAGLWDLPIIKGKTRLNILVMLTPLFNSKGPHDYSAEYIWPYRGLLLGFDPVAVDATGLRIIEAKRLAYFGSRQPLATSPKHIQVAETKYALGVADPSRIDLIRIGWSEGILI